MERTDAERIADLTRRLADKEEHIQAQALRIRAQELVENDLKERLAAMEARVEKAEQLRRALLKIVAALSDTPPDAPTPL